MIIRETSAILTTVQLEKSKLLNIKQHLDALLRKKLRIETEISILRKQIKSKLKISNTKIKASIQLESSDTVSDQDAEQLQKEHPDLFQQLIEFDQIEKEIEEITQYYKES